MIYSSEVLEELRYQNDIVDVISARVDLKQRGTSYVGLCPFHNEKSPSFHVSSDKQLFHCFGCGVSGNVFTFVMQIENHTFIDAVKSLAERVNYQLPEENFSHDYLRKKEEKLILYEINKKATRFYFDSLTEKDNPVPFNYLVNRDISENTRRKFGIGYSSKNRNSIFEYLVNEGYDNTMIEQSGLVIKNKKGGYFDRFSERIMFPIFDINNNIIGFGGRIITDGQPKYLNSPETPIFDKSRNLYGINIAKLSREKTFYLVEGYMDVIALVQNGISNVVAALGTAFNVEHARLIKKYATDVIILFDSDEAGINATLRSIPILVSNGLNVKVLTLKDAKDPDEFLKKFGVEKFLQVGKSAINYIMYNIENKKNKYDLTNPQDIVKFTGEVAEILAKLNNAVEQEVYIKETAKITNISYDSIKSEVLKLVDTLATKANTTIRRDLTYVDKGKSGGKGLNSAKKSILYIIANNYEVYKAINGKLSPSELGDGIFPKLLEILYELYIKGSNIYPADLVNYFDTVEEQKTVSNIFNTPIEFEDLNAIEQAINDAIRTIKISNIDSLIETTKNSLYDDESLQGLLEIQNLSKQRKLLEKEYVSIFPK